MKAAGGKSAEAKKLLDGSTKLTDELKQRTDKLQKALDHEGGDAVKHAKHFRDAVDPGDGRAARTGDAPNASSRTAWPLATYREMLFIK